MSIGGMHFVHGTVSIDTLGPHPPRYHARMDTLDQARTGDYTRRCHGVVKSLARGVGTRDSHGDRYVRQDDRTGIGTLAPEGLLATAEL